MEGVRAPIDERAWRQVVDILLSHDHRKLATILPERFRTVHGSVDFDRKRDYSEVPITRAELFARLPEDAFDDTRGVFAGEASRVNYVYAFLWVALWETRHRRRDRTLASPFRRMAPHRWGWGSRGREDAAVDLFVWDGRVLVRRMLCVHPND